MKIRVKLFGTLRSLHPGYDPEKGISLEFGGQVTVHGLILHLCLSEKQVGIVTIDGKMAKADHMVPDESEVRIFQPIAGG